MQKVTLQPLFPPLPPEKYELRVRSGGTLVGRAPLKIDPHGTAVIARLHNKVGYGFLVGALWAVSSGDVKEEVEVDGKIYESLTVNEVVALGTDELLNSLYGRLVVKKASSYASQYTVLSTWFMPYKKLVYKLRNESDSEVTISYWELRWYEYTTRP